MMRFKNILFLCLVSFQVAQGLPYQSYERLKNDTQVRIKPLIFSEPKDDLEKQDGSSISKDTLINQNLDPSWQAPKPKTELNTLRPIRLEHYAVGTGTRGGGSGLIIKKNQNFNQVVLLEVFRSENLERYSLFFPIDSDLRKLEAEDQVDESARIIFETVLGRILQGAPHLGKKIKYLYETELPFKDWIPLYADLPEVKDEIEYPLEPNTDRVQIAYRRTKHILYSTRAYAAMSALNRAALWLHEYIYALSGLENSLKTQRAVSLFFSSEFVKISQDEAKLGQLLFDLDLLSLSQASLSMNLPPKVRIAEKKQIDNCGALTQMKIDTVKDRIDMFALINGENKKISISRAEAAVIMTAYLLNKSHLQATFPLYKYYGQKILVDHICLNSSLAKITQIHSALAIDEDVAEATRNAVLAEVEYYQAKSNLAFAMDQGTAKLENFVVYNTKQVEFYKAQLKLNVKSITPIEKIVNPKILGESNIAIDP